MPELLKYPSFFGNNYIFQFSSRKPPKKQKHERQSTEKKTS